MTDEKDKKDKDEKERPKPDTNAFCSEMDTLLRDTLTALALIAQKYEFRVTSMTVLTASVANKLTSTMDRSLGAAIIETMPGELKKIAKAHGTSGISELVERVSGDCDCPRCRAERVEDEDDKKEEKETWLN